jgi:hypothetical protein
VTVSRPPSERAAKPPTSGDKAMTIDDLMQQIEETERLVAVYRNADEVIVGTQDQIYSRRVLINRTTFVAAEIGDRDAVRRHVQRARNRLEAGRSTGQQHSVNLSQRHQVAPGKVTASRHTCD